MMSPMLHSRALQTFFKTSIETFSFLPNLAKAMVLIPAFKRKSVFDISRSIKSFQSFLYDASIFSPLCLSVNTSFACNISVQKIKSNAKSVFLNIFCNENSKLCPARQGVALCEDWSASGCAPWRVLRFVAQYESLAGVIYHDTGEGEYSRSGRLCGIRAYYQLFIPVREDFFKKVKNGCDLFMGKK